MLSTDQWTRVELRERCSKAAEEIDGHIRLLTSKDKVALVDVQTLLDWLADFNELERHFL